jgi:hypothetical protein
MSKPTYILESPDAPLRAVELSEGRGKQFLKQLVKYGTFADPADRKNGKMHLDPDWGQKIVENFTKGYRGRIPVPAGHTHSDTELATNNRGELLSVESRADGLWGVLDIRDPKTVEDIESERLWDVSINFDNEYVDSKTGSEVGPTLMHVALVNDPYVKGMPTFGSLSDNRKTIMLSESEDHAVSTAKVKNDKEFPVKVVYKDGDDTKEVTVKPGEEVDVPKDLKDSVATQIAQAVAPETEEAKTKREKAEADKEAADKAKKDAKDKEAEDDKTKVERLEKELSDSRSKIALSEAKSTWKDLLAEGKVVPAQEKSFLSLATAGTTTVSLSDGTKKSLSDSLTELLKAGPKRVSFSEEGKTEGEVDETPYDKLSDAEKAGLEKMKTSPDDYNKYNK